MTSGLTTHVFSLFSTFIPGEELLPRTTLPDPSSDLREDSSEEAPILLSLKTFSERLDLIPLKVGSSFLISRQRKVMLLLVTAMLALGGLLLTYKKNYLGLIRAILNDEE